MYYITRGTVNGVCLLFKINNMVCGLFATILNDYNIN